MADLETPTQRLASMILQQDLGQFVAERRAIGRAWRLIARDLYEATNSQIDVTYETLRSWYGDVDSAPASPSAAAS